MVQPIETILGHSLPPESRHAITFHFPGWDIIPRFSKGDPELMMKLKSIYPRLGVLFATGEVRDCDSDKPGRV
jgi:hypothetical protein